MNYIGFRKSSVYRSRPGAHLLTAWFAILVQLHIFLVLELHNHVISSSILRNTAAAGHSLTTPQGAPAPRPLCPACQVARQGAVQPAVEKLALLPLQALAAVLPGRPSTVPVIFLLHPSGRDPPQG